MTAKCGGPPATITAPPSRVRTPSTTNACHEPSRAKDDPVCESSGQGRPGIGAKSEHRDPGIEATTIPQVQPNPLRYQHLGQEAKAAKRGQQAQERAAEETERGGRRGGRCATCSRSGADEQERHEAAST